MKFRYVFTLVVVSLLSATVARAEAAYPNKAVRFIVPASAGGPSDVIGRLLAQKLGLALGQPVVVENKPGASQTLGSAQVARAEADGYTLLFTTSTPIVMTPFTMKKSPYDVKRELTIVAHIGTTPLVLYANTSNAVASVKDMVQLYKAKPDQLSYGSYGNGSSAHVLGEVLSRQVGINWVHVPYKGVVPEVTDLAAGLLQFGVADIGVPAPFVKSGKIRPIAVTGARRASALPDVPTFAEQGVSGMEPFSPWWGLFAPANTPKPILDRLSVEVVKIVKSPAFSSRLVELGGDPTGLPAAEAQVVLYDELNRWKRIIENLSYLSFE